MSNDRPCLVAASCGWHWRADQALATGDVAMLREHMDVFYVLSQRAWQRCRCHLWERIQAAVA